LIESLRPAALTNAMRSPIWIPKILLTLILSWAGLAYAGLFSPPDWATLKQQIRAAYPNVRQINISDFAQVQKAGKPALLLDVRGAEEFEVSHLRQARLATDLKQALSVIQDTAKDAPIVVYCSVGLRSAGLAQQLQQRGYSKVSNLEGSLFEWANAGLPVYRGSDLVKLVHPYNRKWGQLLNSELRAPL
jgi:rhodanese-related sulfurtransferase